MYIYKTTNILNDKIYIGLSEKNPEESSKYMGSGDSIKKAIQKYGTSSFIKEILEDGIEDRGKLAEAEIKWIAHFRSNDRNIGYNLSPGGDLNSEKLKKKIYQYDRRGNLVEIHNTIDDAKKSIESKNSDLYKVSIRENKPIKGYWWCIEESTRTEILEKETKYNQLKKEAFIRGNQKRYRNPDQLERQRVHMRKIRELFVRSNTENTPEIKETKNKSSRGPKKLDTISIEKIRNSITENWNTKRERNENYFSPEGLNNLIKSGQRAGKLKKTEGQKRKIRERRLGSINTEESKKKTSITIKLKYLNGEIENGVAKKVISICENTGELTEHPSISSASRRTGCFRYEICNSIKNGNSVKGYYWRNNHKK